MSVPTRKRRALATRVMVSTAVGGALAGAVAAGSAMLAVDRLMLSSSDRRLSGAVDVLAGELDEDFEEDEWEPLAEVVDDENSELVTSGVRLAVYSGSHRIAGDQWAPLVPAGTCATSGTVGQRVRSCGGAYDRWTLVAAARIDDAALPFIYLIAGLVAVAVGAATGALASAQLSKVALRPLAELSGRIRELEPKAGARGLGLPSDCEEIELIREALSDLLVRIDALLDHAQRFAADAAHELRTPLTKMRAELELLLEAAPAAMDRTALERVVSQTGELATLTERLLVLAAPLERERLGDEPVALSDVLEDLQRALPERERARVSLKLGGEGLVRGDAALLRSAFANGVQNALKFSGQGEVLVTLACPAEEDERASPSVRVEIRDRGPGVPPELRTRVFEPFFRAHADATPGHGLGLALIGHIVRAHGGSAEFADTASGACLVITLPMWARPV